MDAKVQHQMPCSGFPASKAAYLILIVIQLIIRRIRSRACRKEIVMLMNAGLLHFLFSSFFSYVVFASWVPTAIPPFMISLLVQGALRVTFIFFLFLGRVVHCILMM